MIHQVGEDHYEVALATPGSPGWDEALHDCHPAIRGVAIAGLSAVLAATEGRPPALPMLGDGINNEYNPAFVNAVRDGLGSDAQSLTEKGLSVVAITSAASRLLNAGTSYDYEGQTGVGYTRYGAVVSVDDLDAQRFVGKPLNYGRVVNAQAKSVPEQRPNPRFCAFSIAASLGPELSVGINLSASETTYQSVILEVTTGSRDGDFVGPTVLASFMAAGRFARTINRALRASGQST